METTKTTQEKNLDYYKSLLPEVKEVKVEDEKAQKTFGQKTKELLIQKPVSFLAPGVLAVGGGAIGLAVGGVAGGILGAGIGAQVGIKTADKIGALAVVAFDKVIDVGSDAVIFVSKKAVEGMTYLAKKIYEKIKSTFDKSITKEEVKVDIFEEENEAQLLDDNAIDELLSDTQPQEQKVDFNDLQVRLNKLRNK